MTRGRVHTSYSIYIFCLLFSGLLYFLDSNSLLGPVKYPLEILVLTPKSFVTSVKNTVRNNARILFAKDIVLKINESDELKSEVEAMRARIFQLEVENKRYLELLEAPYPAQWDFIPAKVLGGERYLLINKGKRDGVSEGMAVVTAQTLVGKVHSVGEKSAQVLVLTDPESKVPAKTRRGTRGLVVGEFGNRVIIDRILQRDVLSELDDVFTTGEDGDYPTGVLIGKVDSVINTQEDVYKKGVIIPAVDLNMLDQVFVIKSY